MIQTLQSAGYVVTPCKGKAPVLPRWQQRAALTAAELHQYRGHNVGLVLGVADGTMADLVALSLKEQRVEE